MSTNSKEYTKEWRKNNINRVKEYENKWKRLHPRYKGVKSKEYNHSTFPYAEWRFQRWDSSEIALMKAMSPHYTQIEVSLELGRTAAGVWMKAHKEKISFKKE